MTFRCGVPRVSIGAHEVGSAAGLINALAIDPSKSRSTQRVDDTAVRIGLVTAIFFRDVLGALGRTGLGVVWQRKGNDRGRGGCAPCGKRRQLVFVPAVRRHRRVSA